MQVSCIMAVKLWWHQRLSSSSSIVKRQLRFVIHVAPIVNIVVLKNTY